MRQEPSLSDDAVTTAAGAGTAVTTEHAVRPAVCTAADAAGNAAAGLSLLPSDRRVDGANGAETECAASVLVIAAVSRSGSHDASPLLPWHTEGLAALLGGLTCVASSAPHAAPADQPCGAAQLACADPVTPSALDPCGRVISRPNFDFNAQVSGHCQQECLVPSGSKAQGVLPARRHAIGRITTFASPDSSETWLWTILSDISGALASMSCAAAKDLRWLCPFGKPCTCSADQGTHAHGQPLRPTPQLSRRC